MTDFVIGDLHGHYNDYRRLLLGAALVDQQGNWCGGDNRLILIGDFFDRGIHGIDCVDLTMALQVQAREHGGAVEALLGNHEMMILCAHQFGDDVTSAGMRVMDQWQMWGGIKSDLSRLSDVHVAWLRQLPAMLMIGDTLLLHADAMFYVDHGRTVEQVNASMRQLLTEAPLPVWESTLRAFAEHRAFSALGMTGQRRAEQLLKYYNARLLVHGHTPIQFAMGESAAAVVEAWTYAGGRCVNVDGGIYLGGPGFVHQL
jgi:hypothetical protein